MTPRKIELFVPAVTPFADDLSVDTVRYVAQAQALIAGGAHGLNGADYDALYDQVSLVRSMFAGLSLVPSHKVAVVAQRGDDNYARVRPPFVRLATEHDEAITRRSASQASRPRHE